MVKAGGATLFAEPRFRICGDRSVMVEYGDGIDYEINRKVKQATALLTDRRLDGIKAVIPAYRSLTILYDPFLVDPESLRDQIVSLDEDKPEEPVQSSKIVKIPVCYGGEFGPDLNIVASCRSLSPDDVVALHSGRSYYIFMVGFAPGFCYLGGLDERLHTPRLATPRTLIPAGSVGIAENQTGMYPLASPGGWQIIGRTPLKLFAPERDNPFLYQAGDTIRFVPVSGEKYRKIYDEEHR
ncbi:MAG: 5-oxoprolinase subunit PxpB [Deltaproteobacteria bacterium]|nr:5-oxoprolinase subunit PxpB [Deltaproteobacteria bacterium]